MTENSVENVINCSLWLWRASVTAGWCNTSNPLAPLSIVKIIKISSVTLWSQALSDEGWSFHHDIMLVLIIPVIQLSNPSPQFRSPNLGKERIRRMGCVHENVVILPLHYTPMETTLAFCPVQYPQYPIPKPWVWPYWTLVSLVYSAVQASLSPAVAIMQCTAVTVTTYQMLFLTFGICKHGPMRP